MGYDSGDEQRRTSDPGTFERDMDYLPDRITRDGRRPEHGPVLGELWPVEPGRYRLVAAPACPWASRALVVRRLLGLERVLSVGLPGPVHDERSWTFDEDPGGVDPVLGIHRLRDAYLARDPDYDKGITVPAMVDIPSGPGGHQRLPVDHPRPVLRVDRAPPPRRARTCGPTTSATRWRR